MRKFFIMGLIFVIALLTLVATRSSGFKATPKIKSDTLVLTPSQATLPIQSSTPKVVAPVAPFAETDSVMPIPAAAVAPLSDSDQLVIADFDTGDKPNNLGGDFGSWNKDPNDTTQGCTVSFETDDALNDPAGYSLKLDYDVDSPNPAYNGIWMKLNGLNASAYSIVSFYIRGEGLNNYTKRIKLELKDSAMNSSPYLVSGITDAWQKIEVPFDRFKKIKDWSSLGEFVVVFDDRTSNPKQGTILIDQIAFEKK